MTASRSDDFALGYLVAMAALRRFYEHSAAAIAFAAFHTGAGVAEIAQALDLDQPEVLRLIAKGKVNEQR